MYVKPDTFNIWFTLKESKSTAAESLQALSNSTELVTKDILKLISINDIETAMVIYI